MCEVLLDNVAGGLENTSFELGMQSGPGVAARAMLEPDYAGIRNCSCS